MDSAIKRNVVFGIQDAVVTTTGFLVGAVSAKFGEKVDTRAALLTVVVSSTSMAIGAYQGERSADVSDADRAVLAVGAAVMFVSYLVTGCLLVAAFKFRRRFWPPVLVSLVLLAVAGAFVAEDEDRVFNSFETAGLGLVGILIGYVTGRTLS